VKGEKAQQFFVKFLNIRFNQNQFISSQDVREYVQREGQSNFNRYYAPNKGEVCFSQSDCESQRSAEAWAW
jgi:uncharacterized protein YydD (DUF2326 family)